MVRGVILIVIDCLRADHLSCYGYHRPTTPTIDDLARRGTLWKRAYSTSSWTKPSVTSLLTGLYPSQHRSFQGIKRSKGQLTVTTDVLRSSEPTLAESLSRVGWRCGAFINNAQLGEFSRLNRGFDVYVPNAGKADHLLKLFADWLESAPDQPAFTYLHFLEAHWPYKPRRRHIAAFGGDRDTNIYRDFSARDYGRLRRSVSRGQTSLTDEQLNQMIQMYDGAVRRLDGKVKKVLDILERAGMLEQTAVLVTADHGEEFMDHGRIGHGHSLYEELIHVPLVAVVPDGPQGIRIRQPVSHVDLAATILAMAGEAERMGGRDLLSSDPRPRPVISELLIRDRYSQAAVSRRWKLHRRFQHRANGSHNGTALAAPKWMDTDENRHHCELYDLVGDPKEQVELYGNQSLWAPRNMMIKRLEQWWAETSDDLAPEPAQPIELEPVVVERLRALGYLD